MSENNHPFLNSGFLGASRETQLPGPSSEAPSRPPPWIRAAPQCSSPGNAQFATWSNNWVSPHGLPPPELPKASCFWWRGFFGTAQSSTCAGILQHQALARMATTSPCRPCPWTIVARTTRRLRPKAKLFLCIAWKESQQFQRRQSPCLPSPVDFPQGSSTLLNADWIPCMSELFQTFSACVVVCWGRVGREESIRWVNSVLLSKWNKFHHPLQVHSVFYLYHSHLVQDSGAAGTGDVMHCTNSILFIQWENKVHSLGFFDHA